MIWPFGKRAEHDSTAVDELLVASRVHLAEAKCLRQEAAAVGSSLRASRQRNHFADGVFALGGVRS